MFLGWEHFLSVWPKHMAERSLWFFGFMRQWILFGKKKWRAFSDVNINLVQMKMAYFGARGHESERLGEFREAPERAPEVGFEAILSQSQAVGWHLGHGNQNRRNERITVQGPFHHNIHNIHNISWHAHDIHNIIYLLIDPSSFIFFSHISDFLAH